MKIYRACIRLIVVFLVGFVTLAHPTRVYACLCAGDLTVSGNFATHDAVFTGKVDRIVDHDTAPFSGFDRILNKFGRIGYYLDRIQANRTGFSAFLNVIQSWKGVNISQVEVRTGRGAGDCGFMFQAGQTYLVYANYANGQTGNYLFTDSCTRNSALANGPEDLEYLESRSTIPLKNSVLRFSAGQKLLLVSLSVLTGSLFFGLRAYALSKRSRSRRDP